MRTILNGRCRALLAGAALLTTAFGCDNADLGAIDNAAYIAEAQKETSSTVEVGNDGATASLTARLGGKADGEYSFRIEADPEVLERFNALNGTSLHAAARNGLRNSRRPARDRDRRCGGDARCDKDPALHAGDGRLGTDLRPARHAAQPRRQDDRAGRRLAVPHRLQPQEDRSGPRLQLGVCDRRCHETQPRDPEHEGCADHLHGLHLRIHDV